MLGWGPGARCEQVLDRFWARQRALRSRYTRLCGVLLRHRWSTPSIHLRSSATAERRHPSIPPQRTACPGPRRPAIIAIDERYNVEYRNVSVDAVLQTLLRTESVSSVAV